MIIEIVDILIKSTFMIQFNNYIQLSIFYEDLNLIMITRKGNWKFDSVTKSRLIHEYTQGKEDSVENIETRTKKIRI